MASTTKTHEATPPAEHPAKSTKQLEREEIRLFSHSDIFYWWPVWGLGFLFALLTHWDGRLMAIVPEGAQARRDWRLEVAPGRTETREGLILPHEVRGREVHLDPDPHTKAAAILAAPEQPHVRMARSPYLGTWFFLAFLAVFIFTHAPLRGLWEWIAVLVIALTISLVFLYGWWGSIEQGFRLLHIQINMAGYLFLATWLFAIWAVTTFYFDRLTYMVFSAGQVRIRQAIGEGEKVFDVTNMSMELQPNVLVRHRILGFYDSGDLIVRTGGPRPEVFHWPNVLRVRSKLRRIEQLLQTREVE
jgi:hypothetical protein